MRKNTLRGLVASTALLAASATGAFADISLEISGGQQVPHSFMINLAAIVTGGNLATGPFNNIRVFQQGPAILNDINGSFNIASVRFEDFTDVMVPANTHRMIQNFTWVTDVGMGPVILPNTWTQTSPLVPPVSGAAFATNIRADGNTVTDPGILSFKLFFEGDISNGTHFQIEFWNNNTFAAAYDVKYILRNGQTLADSEFAPTFTPIPLPPAVWSGLAMMAGFGAFLTKRRRDRKTLS